MSSEDVRQDDDYGGVDKKMDMSEEDRMCSTLSEEREIEEDLKKEEQQQVKEQDEEVVQWDGSEAERVADVDAEEYEENSTGIRLSYKLEEEEIYKSLKHSKTYQKNVSLQIRHTVIQAILILLLLVVSVVLRNVFFSYVALVPILSITGLWLIPTMSLKRLSRELSKGKNISVEVFPDVVEVDVNGTKSEIQLDGTCEYDEFEDMILLNPKDGSSLIIPVRAIEPEFLPDVQAMIVSGTLPRSTD